MRRAVSIAMVITFLGMLITGIWNYFPPFDEQLYLPHINSSITFMVLAIIHVWINRLSIGKYFRGLGWWWIPVVLLFTINVIWLGIIMPLVIY